MNASHRAEDIPLEVTKQFRTTLGYLLLIKSRHFLRRSLLRYAVGAAVFAIGMRLTEPQSWAGSRTLFLWLILTGAMWAVGAVVVFISAVVTSIRRRHDTSLVTFAPDRIIIRRPGREDEAHDWAWVLSAEQTERFFFVNVARRFPKHQLVLPKSKLTAEEDAALTQWFIANGKIMRIGRSRLPGPK